jgi:hypothetical protein
MSIQIDPMSIRSIPTERRTSRKDPRPEKASRAKVSRQLFAIPAFSPLLLALILNSRKVAFSVCSVIPLPGVSRSRLVVFREPRIHTRYCEIVATL